SHRGAHPPGLSVTGGPRPSRDRAATARVRPEVFCRRPNLSGRLTRAQDGSSGRLSCLLTCRPGWCFLAMNILRLLQQKLHEALAGLVPNPAPYVAMLKPSQDARFGDYQANCAMALKKVLGKDAPEIARMIVERLRLDDVLEP